MPSAYAIKDDDDDTLLCEFDEIQDFFPSAGDPDENLTLEEGEIHWRTLQIRGVKIADSSTWTPFIGSPIGSSGRVRVCVLGRAGREIGGYYVAAARLEEYLPDDLSGSLMTIDAEIDQMPRPGVEEIWRSWRDNYPSVENAWMALDSVGRRAWLDVVRRYVGREPLSDRLEDGVERVILDGRNVSDTTSFFLSIGEAVNGPGGYFGSSFGGLSDCAMGGFGARNRFTLVWRDSAYSRSALSVEIDSRNGPVTEFELIVATLRASGVVALLE